jgi:tetratricopeptide (TPR) repeat protein/predicted Ser/Thr protein kinase
MIGRRISHYEILEALGSGGMGVVYRAHDVTLDRNVAIKVLPGDRPRTDNARRRFRREAMAASVLSHPNIITIYEISSEGETDFIVMEYVRGSTLTSILKSRSLSLEEALQYAVQIADALAKAHAAGVIHRDMKPGNIMITEDGLVKILDFGLAKFNPNMTETDDGGNLERTKEVTLTQPGMVTGTVFYMSPEQARGERVDARSDIFSFGSVLFEMLTGKLPFTGANSIAVLHNLHFSPPRDLTQLRPDLPPELVTLLHRMLEKDVEKRIQTMNEVSFELRKAAGMSVEPATWQRSASWLPPTTARSAYTPKSPLKKWLWIAGAAIVLLLAAGSWRWLKKGAAPHPQAAQTNLQTPVEDNAYALYQRARQDLDHYDREGNVDNAIKLLDRAVELDPQSAASYAGLAEAYYFKNRANPDPQWQKLSAANADKAISLDSYLAAAHVSQGLAKMQGGDSSDAEKEFRRAGELDPKSSIPHFWLAYLFDKTEKGAQALPELKIALQDDPKDWRGYMELGLNDYQSARYNEAIQNWEQALKLEPDNVLALRNLSAAYHLVGRDDDAAAALQRALEIKPSADVYNNLGTIRFYQGHYAEAVPAFEKTVQLAANSFDNWGNLGDAYRWTTGNEAKAKQAYQTATRLVREEIAKHPDQLVLHADLAMYLAKSGDKQKALQELKPVEEAKTKDPTILYLSSLVYEICGERQKALDALAASVQAGESLADIKNEPELVHLRADPRYQLEVLSAAATQKP